MGILISRWSVLFVLVTATLVGVEHRLATLTPPPPMVSAATFAHAQ